MDVKMLQRDVLGILLLFYMAWGITPPRKVSCYHGDENNLSVYNYSLYDIHRENLIHLSQFEGKQEPGANGTEILNSLKYVRPGGGFEPNFVMLEKSDVNGANEIPLYTYLKSYCPPSTDAFFNEECRLHYHPFRTSDVRWNFEKFLINKYGQPVSRYTHTFPPENIANDVYDLLQEDV